MTVQMTLNQFNALTLNDKFEMFGEEIFNVKRFNLIEYLLEDWEADSETLSIDLGVSKKSLGSTVGALRWAEIITINETLYGDKIYFLDVEALENRFFNLDKLTRLYKIVEIIEETQEEETQEKETQEEETQEEETQEKETQEKETQINSHLSPSHPPVKCESFPPPTELKSTLDQSRRLNRSHSSSSFVPLLTV
tara:strand:+ start:700 stop:1284 length:585 start_codon:yes stop_codon:yes gene_type:complete